MYRPLTFLFLSLLCIAGARAAEPVAIGQLYQINSPTLTEDRSYRVYLPASYRWAANRRYPVLYVLDGRTRFGHTATAVEALAAAGDIPEMIVVAIDSTEQRTRDFTPTNSEAIAGGGADKYRRFLSTELVPAIEQEYRANGYRVLAGHSLGGLFVLHVLSAEPSLFQAYVALAPTLDWDKQVAQRSLQKTFETDSTVKGFAFVARADDGGAALADFEAVADTFKNKAPPGLRWQAAAYPQETHASVPVPATVDALRSLYQGYRLSAADHAKGIANAEEHFSKVSRLVGTPLAVTEEALSGVAYAQLDAKPKDALKLFQRNLDANPNSADAHLGMAEALAKNGKWKDAAKEADRAVALSAEYQLPPTAQSYYKDKAARIKEGPKKKGAK
ncbi:MAG TPA: alpha/beta hydrolase-fold protein [Tahibacter sp.]|uniref:alpha/beta hydrolase-fold protein n=1 Tax=Tahibacter sp. TaxID=2056211 RepID=UPI002B63D1A8|nr:alpha/beta hydrolase-fold protein [Tahibacter sp.]HSX59536.1 alpha/beta hydrolase-fold protein [Tahibacter sp.]